MSERERERKRHEVEGSVALITNHLTVVVPEARNYQLGDEKWTQILIGKLERKTPFWRPVLRRNDTIKTDLKMGLAS